MLKKIKKNYKQIKRRWSWFLYKKRQISNTDALKYIAERIKKDKVIKLNIGCGEKNYSGYINIDAVPLEGTDIVMDIPNELHLISSNVASEILFENVFEHFYKYQQDDILKQCHRILNKNARLVINGLPNFDGLIDAYLNKKKGDVNEVFDLHEVYSLTHGDPQPHNSPHQLHKDLFSEHSIRELLNRNNFKIEQLLREGDQVKELSTCFSIFAVKS